MSSALEEIVRKAESLVIIEKGDIVIDTGSNDGTLLDKYKEKEIVTIGFEPSNIGNLAPQNIKTIPDYFNYASLKAEVGEIKAKVITSISMFYDLEEPNTFVADIKKCLHNDGIWIIQMNYLGSMLDDLSFDNICHEHLQYYSLISLKNILDRHDLKIIDVEVNDINGGSFRIYIKHFGEAEPSVENMLNKELRQGLDNIEVYKKFELDIENIKTDLVEILSKLNKLGKKIYIYGASTRGLVVLQYCNIDNKLAQKAIDIDETKWGKYIVGTGIEISKPGDFDNDYFFVLPYHFRKEIAKREIEFLKRGGNFIIAIPKVRIEGYNDY